MFLFWFFRYHEICIRQRSSATPSGLMKSSISPINLTLSPSTHAAWLWGQDRSPPCPIRAFAPACVVYWKHCRFQWSIKSDFMNSEFLSPLSTDTMLNRLAMVEWLDLNALNAEWRCSLQLVEVIWNPFWPGEKIKHSISCFVECTVTFPCPLLHTVVCLLLWGKNQLECIDNIPSVKQNTQQQGSILG